MKIALVTDAWRPQVNGVVTTLVELDEDLRAAAFAALRMARTTARTTARERAQQFGWTAVKQGLVESLLPARGTVMARHEPVTLSS